MLPFPCGSGSIPCKGVIWLSSVLIFGFRDKCTVYRARFGPENLIPHLEEFGRFVELFRVLLVSFF